MMTAGVRKLRHLGRRGRDANVVEAGGLSEIGDGSLWAGEEMHRARQRRARRRSMERKFCFSARCIGGRVRGIDAGDDDVIFAASVKAALPQRGRHAVQHLGAQHLAVVST